MPGKGILKDGELGYIKEDRKLCIGKTDGNVEDFMYSQKELGEGIFDEIPVTMTGTTVSTDMVSPIEHDVKCKVSGVEDLTAVTVTRCGKNLFDGEIEIGGIDPTNGVLQDISTKTRSVNFIPVLPNTTYVFYYKLDTDYDDKKWIIGYDENKKGITDGGHSVPSLSNFKSECGLIETRQSFGVFTTTAQTRFIKWYNIKSKNLNAEVQIELGNKLTEYQPYIGSAFHPSPSGTVTGMKSISPSMTILTDNPGANLEVTYNADTKKYIEKNGALTVKQMQQAKIIDIDHRNNKNNPHNITPKQLNLGNIQDGKADGSLKTSGAKVEDASYSLGMNAFAEGFKTIASADYQHVQGKYNKEDNSKAFIIGNGIKEENRSNAFTVDWEGNVEIAGAIKAQKGLTITKSETLKDIYNFNEINRITWSDGSTDYYAKLVFLNDGKDLLEYLSDIADKGFRGIQLLQLGHGVKSTPITYCPALVLSAAYNRVSVIIMGMGGPMYVNRRHDGNGPNGWEGWKKIELL